MSKRTHPRKQRVVEMRVDFGRDMVLAGMSAPGEEPFQFYGVDGKPVIPKHIEFGMGYARGAMNDLKVINRAAADGHAMQRDPTKALTRFASLLAVDTNTRNIGGDRVSVTASVFIANFRFEGPRWFADLVDQDPYEFHNARMATERLGWCDVLERAVRTALPAPVGVIVDSELDRLGSMNRRDENIVPGFPLPPGYELVYASAEVGVAEYLGNGAIRRCDRFASEILDKIEKDDAVRSAPFWEPGDNWTDRRRHWQKNAGADKV